MQYICRMGLGKGEAMRDPAAAGKNHKFLGGKPTTFHPHLSLFTFNVPPFASLRHCVSLISFYVFREND